jgi:hypothetical protein
MRQVATAPEAGPACGNRGRYVVALSDGLELFSQSVCCSDHLKGTVDREDYAFRNDSRQIVVHVLPGTRRWSGRRTR